MVIKYFGHSAFFIKSKEARIITDPYSASTGLSFPKTEADLVTISHSHQDHNSLQSVTGDPLIIDYPGEFEKKEVRVIGYKSYHDNKKGEERGENIVYKIEADDISVLHCGDLGTMPSDEFIDQIGEVDVLLVPVGGVYTIDAQEAIQLIKKIEPNLVIPMHYANPQLNEKVFSGLAPVEDFLKKLGKDSIAPEAQLTLKKDDLQGEMRVIVMEISS